MICDPHVVVGCGWSDGISDIYFLHSPGTAAATAATVEQRPRTVAKWAPLFFPTDRVVIRELKIKTMRRNERGAEASFAAKKEGDRQGHHG